VVATIVVDDPENDAPNYLTSQEKFRQICDTWPFGVRLKRSQIKLRHPEITEADVERRLLAGLQYDEWQFVRTL
jgi:hypothetical protein